MILEKVVLSVYDNTKSTEPKFLMGDFEVFTNVRNGRTKVVHTNTEKVYWVNTEELNAKITEFENKQKIPEPTPSDAFVVSGDSVGLPKPVIIGVDLSPVTYTVTRGDTLYSIADKFGVSPSSIVSLNGSETFAVGRKIRIK